MYTSTALVQSMLLLVSTAGAYLFYTILVSKGAWNLILADYLESSSNGNSSIISGIPLVDNYLIFWTTVANSVALRHAFTKFPYMAYHWLIVLCETQRTGSRKAGTYLFLMAMLEQICGFGIASSVFCAAILSTSNSPDQQSPSWGLDRLNRAIRFLIVGFSVGTLVCLNHLPEHYNYILYLGLWFIYPQFPALLSYYFGGPDNSSGSVGHPSQTNYPSEECIIIACTFRFLGYAVAYKSHTWSDMFWIIRTMYIPDLPILPAQYATLKEGIADLVVVDYLLALAGLYIYAIHRYLRYVRLNDLGRSIKSPAIQPLVIYPKLAFYGLVYGPYGLAHLLLEPREIDRDTKH